MRIVNLDALIYPGQTSRPTSPAPNQPSLYPANIAGINGTRRRSATSVSYGSPGGGASATGALDTASCKPGRITVRISPGPPGSVEFSPATGQTWRPKSPPVRMNSSIGSSSRGTDSGEFPELADRAVRAVDGYQVEHASHAARGPKDELASIGLLCGWCLHSGLRRALVPFQGERFVLITTGTMWRPGRIALRYLATTCPGM